MNNKIKSSNKAQVGGCFIEIYFHVSLARFFPEPFCDEHIIFYESLVIYQLKMQGIHFSIFTYLCHCSLSRGIRFDFVCFFFPRKLDAVQ